MIYKNVASQSIGVFAYDSTTGAAKTGDAANITAYISLDFAAPAQTNDVNPTELDAVNAPGWYVFDLAQAESNAEVIVLAPVSATADILIEQVQVVTQDASISSRASQTSLDTIDTNVDSILDDTGTDIPASIAALNDLSAAEVWAYSSRTLTQSAASVASAVAGSVITITRGDTLSAALTNIGALTGYVSLDFTVKKNQDDTDANAILRIRLNATGTGDGLITINKVSSDLTAANGSITIDDAATGDITIALAAEETDDLVAHSGYFYDVQMITATAVTTLTEGICNVAPDVTRAVA